MGLFDIFKKKKEEPKDIVLEETELALKKGIITEEEYNCLMKGYNDFNAEEVQEKLKDASQEHKNYVKASMGIFKLPSVQNFSKTDIGTLLSVVNEHYTNPNITEEKYKSMSEELANQEHVLVSLRILEIFGDLRKNIENYESSDLGYKRIMEEKQERQRKQQQSQQDFYRSTIENDNKIKTISNSADAQKVLNYGLKSLQVDAMISEMEKGKDIFKENTRENDKSGNKKI